MNPRSIIILSALATTMLTNCDKSVSLKYATKADAQTETLFARGWLPDIIPASSENISMENDLDLNITNGEFSFSQKDHDRFVTQLIRTASKDKIGFSAYSYEEWIFWVSDNKNLCHFSTHLIPDRQ